MIEDETLGLKVAENPEVAFWEEFKKERQTNLKAHQRNIIIDEELLALADKKIIEAKNGKRSNTDI